MPMFQYEAMDASGKEIKQEIEAADSIEAVSRIRAMGFFPTKVKEKGGRKKAAKAAEPGKRKKSSTGFAIGRVKNKQLCQFARQLSTLQDAGLPILRSLRILEQQQKAGLLKSIIRQVADDVEGGATLSEAMGRHPKAFDRLFTNMVQAGEAGGCAGGHPPASGGLHGKGPAAQEEGGRGDDLPGRGHEFRRRHRLHDDVAGGAQVQRHLQGLRRETARHHRGPCWRPATG